VVVAPPSGQLRAPWPRPQQHLWLLRLPHQPRPPPSRPPHPPPQCPRRPLRRRLRPRPAPPPRRIGPSRLRRHSPRHPNVLVPLPRRRLRRRPGLWVRLRGRVPVDRCPSRFALPLRWCHRPRPIGPHERRSPPIVRLPAVRRRPPLVPRVAASPIEAPPNGAPPTVERPTGTVPTVPIDPIAAPVGVAAITRLPARAVHGRVPAVPAAVLRGRATTRSRRPRECLARVARGRVTTRSRRPRECLARRVAPVPAAAPAPVPAPIGPVARGPVAPGPVRARCRRPVRTPE
jgi:hypothetical protein